jgi:hypothetical protein
LPEDDLIDFVRMHRASLESLTLPEMEQRDGWTKATEFGGEDDLAAPEGRRVEAYVSSGLLDESVEPSVGGV